MSPRQQFDNDSVRTLLKSKCDSRLRLPSQIHFTLTKEGCNIHMPADCVCENFQCDFAAFEGWAVGLHAWLDSRITFSWEVAHDLADNHYQRFLYRVIRLSTAAPWFEVRDNCRELLAASLVLDSDGASKQEPGYHVVNVPMKGRDKMLDPGSKELENYTEEELEMLFYNNHKSLFEAAGLQGSPKALRQIPIGVFKEKLTNETKVFTGGASMVDLGALCEDKNVALFELKKPGNAKVGALSEVVFYSHVIRDVQKGTFGYPPDKIKATERAILDSDRVVAFILASRLHPLLNNERVFSALNEAFCGRRQEFGFIAYTGTPDSLRCSREF